MDFAEDAVAAWVNAHADGAVVLRRLGGYHYEVEWHPDYGLPETERTVKSHKDNALAVAREYRKSLPY